MIKKYIIPDSIIGPIVLIYSKKEDTVQIEEIILNTPFKTSKDIAIMKYGKLETGHSKKIVKISKEIKKYLHGENYEFSLEYLNLDKCSDFQRKVLEEEFNSEFGSVNYYKDIAINIGKEKSSRAVGNALRNNPFPLIIPCHRTIRSDNSVGGFSGIAKENEYKIKLLELEGNNIKNNKVFKNK